MTCPPIPNEPLESLRGLHLNLQFANRECNEAELKMLAKRLRDLLVTAKGRHLQGMTFLKETAAAACYCALELEKGQLSREANEVYQHAIEVFPQDERLHAQHADLLADLGNIEQASKHLEIARALNPTSKRVRLVEIRHSWLRPRTAAARGASFESIVEEVVSEVSANHGDRIILVKHPAIVLHNGQKVVPDFELRVKLPFQESHYLIECQNRKRVRPTISHKIRYIKDLSRWNSFIFLCPKFAPPATRKALSADGIAHLSFDEFIMFMMRIDITLAGAIHSQVEMRRVAARYSDWGVDSNSAHLPPAMYLKGGSGDLWKLLAAMLQ